MKRFLGLTGVLLALSVTAPADASVIDARFAGTVDTQTNSTFTIGAAIVGEFVYDTVAARYLSFVIGGQSVAPGFTSTASVTPDRFSAIYRAQLSPVTQGGTVNSTFSVDLEGIDPWPSTSAVALLVNASQIASNLDTASSRFGFFTGNADGTNVRSVNATLDRLQVTAIPEPGSVALMVIGFVAAAARRARRRPC